MYVERANPNFKLLVFEQRALDPPPVYSDIDNFVGNQLLPVKLERHTRFGVVPTIFFIGPAARRSLLNALN